MIIRCKTLFPFVHLFVCVRQQHIQIKEYRFHFIELLLLVLFFLSGISVVISFPVGARTSHSAFRLRLPLSPKFYCSNCQNTLLSQFCSHVSIKMAQRKTALSDELQLYLLIWRRRKKKHRQHHWITNNFMCTLWNIVMYLYIFIYRYFSFCKFQMAINRGVNHMTNNFFHLLNTIFTDGISLMKCHAHIEVICPLVAVQSWTHFTALEYTNRRWNRKVDGIKWKQNMLQWQ